MMKETYSIWCSPVEGGTQGVPRQSDLHPISVVGGGGRGARVSQSNGAPYRRQHGRGSRAAGRPPPSFSPVMQIFLGDAAVGVSLL